MLDAVHQVVSLETENLVVEGGISCVNGLNDELISKNRFENVVKVSNADLRSYGAGVFPSALDWSEVERICRETGTDALFSRKIRSVQLARRKDTRQK